MRHSVLLLVLLLPAVTAAGVRRGPAVHGTASTPRPVSRQHQLSPGLTIEPGSVAFFSDLHIAYGKVNRKASPGARKNMIAIADLLRTTPGVSQVVFAGDYYHAPHLDGLSPKQKAAALVRGVSGFTRRLGQKPLHILFGNHDLPLIRSGDAWVHDPALVKAMADALEKKQVGVIGTDHDRSYRFGLPDGALIHVSHAPAASSSSIATAVQSMSFGAPTHTERAREKMSSQPRPAEGEWVSADSHVVAFDPAANLRGNVTVVNLGTAGSESRPVGDPFTVAIRQPTRGWLFLRPTSNGFVPYNPRGDGKP